MFAELRKVKDLDWNNKKYVRAGIIPYVIQGDIIFYAFGLESGIGAIGDFGGHKEHGDRDFLDAAIREYREEALNIFGDFTRESLQDCFVLDGNNTVEILVRVNGNIYEYTKLFKKMVGDNSDHEVQSIIWLSSNQLINALDSQQKTFDNVKLYHMYNKIHNVLNLNRVHIKTWKEKEKKLSLM
jgi:hypothetical protein